jgi:hypothetical protein
MLTIGTLTIGSAKAIGTLEHPSTFHMMAGYVVFIIALGGMILITNVITRFDSPPGSSLKSPRASKETPPPQTSEGDPY